MTPGPRRLRLDAELVRRGLARSREQASSLIASGRVTVAGQVATKAATAVALDVALVVRDDDDEAGYVSRGGHKLAGAVTAFLPQGLVIAGRRCLDAGASTGGFTDVLLRQGAREVIAVDVGYGQLAWSLQSDPRVVVRDRTNVRDISVADLGGMVDLVVADLSFISLRLVLSSLAAVTATTGDMLLMVKPQFEVGKDKVGRRGVVRDLDLRSDAVWEVALEAQRRGWGACGIATSPLPGPAGNVEFFVWLRFGPSRVSRVDIDREVRRTAGWGMPGERVGT